MTIENLIPLGILVIIIGFILVIIGALSQTRKGKSEFAFVGFIGPIPIGFGSNKNILILTTVVALILFLIIIFLMGGSK
jgi:uncharacterized protein (TIGR00304 family)